MNPSAAESLYVTSLEEIWWGGTLVAITLAMHGFGMLLTLRVNGDLKHRFEPKPTFTSGMFILILASWMIILVHLIEVMIWAGFFVWKGAMPNHSTSYYFSLNEYTTVGSNFNLPQRWRLLEGMLATAGLLCFAWSTGVLLTIAQAFQDQQMRLLRERREKRRPKHVSTPPNPQGNAGQPPLRETRSDS